MGYLCFKLYVPAGHTRKAQVAVQTMLSLKFYSAGKNRTLIFGATDAMGIGIYQQVKHVLSNRNNFIKLDNLNIFDSNRILSMKILLSAIKEGFEKSFMIGETKKMDGA